jgi:NitT/TauT family transport system ATP-binding protein
MPRPRDVFRMHDSDAFRALYDAIWVELERQVQTVDKPR